MAVYVDDRNLPAGVPGGAVVRARWGHLFADTEGELRAFAATIGLKQAWIQDPGQPQVHFDVTARMRQRAIAAGATPATWRHAGDVFAHHPRHAAAAAAAAAAAPPAPRGPGTGRSGHGGAQEAARGQALRQAAHLYLGHGLLPVPGWGATPAGECCCPRGAACPRPGKHPRSVPAGPGEAPYSWKPLACHTHPEVDHRFADGGRYAAGNLMLAIPPGMLVIDQDDDDGGRHAIATLTARLGALPATLAHATPHGVHRIYRTPPGWTGRAWVGKNPRNPLPPGVDLRVPGQILMAPPSRVPAAGGLAAYGPVAGTAAAELPAAYLAAWTPPQPPTARPRLPVPVPPDRAGAAAAYVHAKITGIAAGLAAHEPGGRNTAIYTAALKVGSTLGAARTTPGAGHAAAAWAGQAAEDALMDAAEANGYIAAHGPAAARSAIRSGLRNGLREPRPLPDFTTRPAAPAPHQARAASRGTGPRGPSPARDPTPQPGSGAVDRQPHPAGHPDQPTPRAPAAPTAARQPGQLSRTTGTAPCPRCGTPHARPAAQAHPGPSHHTPAPRTGLTPGSPDITQAAARAAGRAPEPAPSHPEAEPEPAAGLPGPAGRGPAVAEASDRDREKEASG